METSATATPQAPTTARRPGPVLALLVALGVGGALVAVWAFADEQGWLLGGPLLAAVLAALVWLLAKVLRAALPLVAAVLAVFSWPLGATGASAWSDLMTEQRGDRVEAVVMERREADGTDGSADGTGYLLERANGMGAVKGGELRPEVASFQVLDRITVLEHPEGAAPPTLPEDLHTVRWAGFWGGSVAVLWALSSSGLLQRWSLRRPQEPESRHRRRH